MILVSRLAYINDKLQTNKRCVAQFSEHSTPEFKLSSPGLKSTPQRFECPDFFLLTSFKLEQTTDLDFRYVYTCAETNDGASQAEKTTEWSALKQEKAELGVLEQLEVQCPYGETEYDWFVAALQLDLNWKTEVTVKPEFNVPCLWQCLHTNCMSVFIGTYVGDIFDNVNIFLSN
jgi:hypothetical protein